MATDTFGDRALGLVLYVLNPLVFAILAIYEAVNRLGASRNRRSVPRAPAERSAALERHSVKLARVQSQVRAWNTAGRLAHMCTGRPTWQSISVHPADKAPFTQINLTGLDEILELDKDTGLLHVEPGMCMGALTAALVPLGWCAPVIPEFELLTIGGLVNGAGVETSSHRYGLFSDTCTEYEIVLASGEVVHCRDDDSDPESHSDLFRCIAMSHGTLGFLTAVKMKLRRVEPWVRVECYTVHSVEEMEKALTKGFDTKGAPEGDSKEHLEGTEFVEGLVNAPDNAVVMLGDFASEEQRRAEGGRVNHVNRWYKPWFYKHVESKYAPSHRRTGRNGAQPLGVEFIPTRDYYHRHSRGIFWETAILLPYGNSVLFRYLLGWIYPLNYQLMRRISPQRVTDLFLLKNHVLQDFVVPLDRMGATLQFAHDLVAVYPVWLCPVRLWNKPGRARAPAPEMLLDVGIYGNTPKTAEFDPVTTTRAMERFVLENRGFQGTYADIYMSREEFMKMFDFMAGKYYAVRDEYGAKGAFPDVYDKISYQARRGTPCPSAGAGNENSLP